MTITAHSIAQVLAMILQALNLFAGIVPVKYQPFVALGIALVQAALAWYNHYYTPQGTKIVAALFLALFLCGSAQAQTQAPPTPMFSVSTQAMALRIGGQTVPGADAIGTFTLIDKNENLIQLQTDNILAPAINLQAYLGGVKAYPYFLSKPLEKTTLSSVKPYIHVALGIVRNVPAVGNATQHYAALAGGGFDFKVNDAFSLGPRIEYFNAPGFGSGPHGVAVSANLTLVLKSK